MAMKPVDRDIKVVLGPIVSSSDFITPDESLVFNSAGLELDVVLEKTNGSVVTTALVPTSNGDYDFTPADQGYYELELPASGGAGFNNSEKGTLTVVGNADGVMPFRTVVSYDVVPGTVYDALVAGTETLTIPAAGTEDVPVGLAQTFYGSVSEATDYFSYRLHSPAWLRSSVADRPKALWAATMILDALNYKGHKHPVYTLLTANEDATDEEIRTAEASQALEFPRGADTTVPLDVRKASYEIAYALLNGKDPEMELENLGITSQGYASVRTTYARNQVPIEHIINGVPSPQAWRWLKPFLRDDDAIKLSRVS